MNDQSVILALVVVVILIVLYWAYDKCRLDKYLSTHYQKCKKGAGGFVGAMAQHPSLVPCAFPTSQDWEFNRCNYT